MYTVKRRVQADLKHVKPGNILATKNPDKSEQTDNTKNVHATDNGFLAKMLKTWRSGSNGSKQSVQMRRYSVLVMASMLLAVSGCAVSTEAG